MSKKMNFSSVVALVLGSQVGSAIFMLPATLALLGPSSLFGWLISGTGAILLALIFAQLCIRMPNGTGPHSYVEPLFGKRVSFYISWTYWLASWISSLAVVIATVSYLSPLFGITDAIVKLFLEIFLLVGVTLINMRSVNLSSSIGFILTLLKCIPLLAIPIAAFFYFHPENFQGITEGGEHTFDAIKRATLLTFWGFIGLETATVSSENINNPKKTIPRAVLFGTIGAALIYLLNSVGIMGVIPMNSLANEGAPYATAAHIMFGNWGQIAISIVAIIACLGTLNAWVLTSGQAAYAAAKEGLFPKSFSKTNTFTSPYISLALACLGSIPFLILTLHENLVTQVNMIIDISVTTFLFIYIACILSFMYSLYKERKGEYMYWIIAFLALGFCLGILLSVSFSHLCLTILFILSGLPIYLSRRQEIHQTTYSTFIDSAIKVEGSSK
jgi:APA family basic amino acid/polyamine antiporter